MFMTTKKSARPLFLRYSSIASLLSLALFSEFALSNDSYNQVETIGSQEIPLDFVWSPLGQRTDNSRWSDDGAVIYADANGILLWQTQNGQVTPIPNSSKAVPLIVSNNKVMVWHNAFNNPLDVLPGDGNGVIPLEIYIYNMDPITGGISAPVVVNDGDAQRMLGANILATAPITTTSVAYHLITSEVGGASPYRIYRVTLNGDVQAVSIINEGGSGVGREGARVYGHGTDGTTVFYTIDQARPPENRGQDVFWVDGARAGATTGIWEELGAADSEPGVLGSRTMYTSANRVVYELNLGEDNYRMIDARRNPFISFSATDNNDITPGQDDYFRFLQISTQTVAGDTRWAYALNREQTAIYAYTLNNLGFQLQYTAQLPNDVRLDEWATVKKINPLDGSAIISSDNIDNVIWVGNIGTALENATLFPASSQAEGMFVSSEQALVWNNAKAPVGPGGVIPDIQILHYQRSTVETTVELVASDMTSSINGKTVLSTPIFSPAIDKWSFKTLEKTGNRTTTIRSYGLSTFANRDSDGDGIPDEIESALGTNPNAADTDGDGLSDGDEVYPYHIISGNFTWEEALADALRRGGRLAVIANRDDHSAMIRRFRSANYSSLWLGATDAAVEGTWRWVDDASTVLNNMNWQSAGILSWTGFHAQADSSIPWALGRPNNVGNADGLILRANGLFEDRPLLERRGYLIEYPRSNPLNTDTDGDGRNDFDERRLASDPNVRDSFTGVPILPNPVGNVPFSNIAGTYHFLVQDDEGRDVGILTLKLSKKAGFSYQFKGLTSKIKASGRGTFSGNGVHFGPGPKGLSDVISLAMQMVEVSEIWEIRAVMTRNNGEQLGSVGRPAKYSKANPYPVPGAFTMALPLAGPAATGVAGVTEPSGEGVVTGNINRAGMKRSNIILPNGERSTSSGPILADDYTVIHALSSRGSKSALVGYFDMLSPRPSLDYGGTVRFYAEAATISGQATTAIDQIRLVEGSVYIPPAKGLAPLSNLFLAGWNISFNLTDGAFDGVSRVAAWGANNKIFISPSPTTSSKAAYNAKSGLMTFSHTETDPSLGTRTIANGFAVVLQRPVQTRGFYYTPLSSGRLSVTEHDGSAPPLTMIAPVSTTVPVGASVYNVQVSTPGSWQVILPENPWVSAEIIQGGTEGLNGNGNGIVRITVQENPTRPLIWRYLTIEIAGIKHNITQDYIQRR